MLNIYAEEHGRLYVTRDCDKKLKKYYKLDAWQGRWALIDRVRYWKNRKLTDYTIILECPRNYVYTITLYVNQTQMFKIPEMRFNDIIKVTESLWMSVQHLVIDDYDGKNWPWSLDNFYKWWDDRLSIPYEKYDKNHIFKLEDFKKGDD